MEESDDERGELVTDILQRHLSCLAISDSPLCDLLSLLHSNSAGAVADVVFHVPCSDSSPPCKHTSADENPRVIRVLAHSSILRQQSDYFREILQRHADHHNISVNNQELQHEEHASNVGGADASAPASSMDGTPQSDDPMYILQNSNMQVEHVAPIGGANLPDQSVSASTMNDIIGREVLAHVQAQIMERSADDDQVARRLSEQEYYSCKSSFVSAEGSSEYQAPENTSDDHSSLCSMSTATTQLPATSSMSDPIALPQGSSANLSRNSLTLRPSDCQPRKSILLNNDDRKVSITGSMRKSVRFSLEQADIILPTSISNNCIPRPETGGNKQAEEGEERGIKHLNEEESSDNFVDEKGLSGHGEAMCGKEITTSVMEPECIDKLLIKRRHTEVSMVMERGGTAKEEKENEEDASTYNRFKFFVVKKLTWTAPALIGIMEWLYLGMCHINLQDLPGLYDAAYRAVITSLTWCIRRHSMPEYLHLALSSPLHCKSLLDLCLIADCTELSSLKSFCKALQAINGQPKIAVLETKPLPGDVCALEFLSEGFFVLDGHPLCVLKSCKTNEFESPREYESTNDRPLSFLTFAKHLQPSPSSTFSQQKNISNCESTYDHQQTWKVVLLDDDPAGSFYAFFKYVVTMLSMRSLTKKAKRSIKKRKSNRHEEQGQLGSFKLQMITRFKVGSILVACLRETIGEGIVVREKRGAGAFIKGPSYCTSIVIKGDPWKVLMAAKTIPYDMVGRSALKIRAPCAKTFSSLFHASHTFGVDLHSQSIVLVKPLYVLIKVLEFITNLNNDAYEAPSTERTFIELNQPTEPF